MKQTLNKAWAWLKSSVAELWSSADFVELPSRSAWRDFKQFKKIRDTDASELLTMFLTVPAVILTAWLRLLVPTVFAAGAVVIISGGLLWKLATFWKRKSK
jgi:hypothetical protein